MEGSILVIGTNARLRKRLMIIFMNISNISFSDLDGTNNLQAYLSTHRVDAIFLEETIAHDAIRLVSNFYPTMPIVVYGNILSCEQTRSYFHSGVVDVINPEHLSLDEIAKTVELVLDPAFHKDRGMFLSQSDRIDTIINRGRHFEQQIMSGAPPAFYMNGNRAVLLRANVICKCLDHLWEHHAVLAWIDEFGINNTFCFSIKYGQLRLGAIVEHDYINAASYRRMLTSKLSNYFESIKEYSCVAAAAYISSDLLSEGILHQLNDKVSTVFYLQSSQVLTDDGSRSNVGISSAPLKLLYNAVATKDIPVFHNCMSEIVAGLCQGMPNVFKTRLELYRIFWNCVAIIGSRDHFELDSETHLNDIFGISALIESTVTSMMKNSTPEISEPLPRLIQRIDSNPGLSITIDQAAQELNFSRTHFCRLFRKETGMSFTEYLTKKRIETACNLLKRTHMSIADIASAIGIENTYYFKQTFKKEMGIDIESWRKREQSSTGEEIKL